VADTREPASPLGLSAAGDGQAASWAWANARLPAVEQRLKQVADQAGPLRISARYHLVSGGSRFRARLALATGHVLGLSTELMTPAAAACELLHNASLVHDDLQDQDTLRRGRQTVWKRFGTDIALNLGDYFLSAAHGLLLETPCAAETRLRLVTLFTQRIAESIRGQVLSARFTPVFTVADYEDLVRAKTGAFFALPAESALALAAAAPAVRGPAVAALEWLGVAYQIQDDLGDLLGRKTGRAAGSDLRAGVVNALLVQCAACRPHPLLDQIIGRLREDRAQVEPAVIAGWARQLCESAAFERTLGQLDRVYGQVDANLRQVPSPLAETLREGCQQFASSAALRRWQQEEMAPSCQQPS
jgi:geranylgeranyl pyrophosphate synthase